MAGNGDLVARYAMDLRETRRRLAEAEAARKEAERRLSQVQGERDRAVAECLRYGEEAEAAARALAGMHDLYDSARRRWLRDSERQNARPPLCVMAEDDGEIDTPAGGRA